MPWPDFNAFVGTETGILKGVSVNPKAVVTKNFHPGFGGALDKADEITAMSKCGDNLVLGLRNTRVKVFDAENKTFAKTIDASEEDVLAGKLVGVHLTDDDRRLLTANETGSVRVWNPDTGDLIHGFNAVEKELNSGGKLKKNAFKNDEERLKHLANLKAGRSLTCMKVKGRRIATGGKENDLQVWELGECQATNAFMAKNVKLDELQLRVPVWISDVAFINGQDGRLLSTANRTGHVRLYDTRSDQRRPQADIKWEDEALTALCNTNDTNKVLVGSTKGNLALFDFRKKAMVRKYKGSKGSVRSIAFDETTGYFASVGLDRFIRIFHVDSKSSAGEKYLKSRLNCVLLDQGFNPLESEDERNERVKSLRPSRDVNVGDEESDDDSVQILSDSEADDDDWDEMEKIGQKRSFQNVDNIDDNVLSDAKKMK